KKYKPLCLKIYIYNVIVMTINAQWKRGNNLGVRSPRTLGARMKEKAQELQARIVMRTMIGWARLFQIDTRRVLRDLRDRAMTKAVMSRPGRWVLDRARVHVGHF